MISAEDHLTDDMFLEALEGRPSARVLAHLEACPQCRALRTRISDVLGALRFAQEPALYPSTRSTLVARYARKHRRSAGLRMLTMRIPLYQAVAAVVALAILCQVLPRRTTAEPACPLPHLSIAASDLWFDSAVRRGGAD